MTLAVTAAEVRVAVLALVELKSVTAPVLVEALPSERVPELLRAALAPVK